MDTRLTVMHEVGWRFDLQVTLSLCCKWLEWWGCDHAWPFQIAHSQWLTLHWVLWPSGPAYRRVTSQRSGWSPDVSYCPATFHCRPASLHSSLIWSDSSHTSRRAFLRAADALHTSVRLRHGRPAWCWWRMSVTSFSVYLCPHKSLLF